MDTFQHIVDKQIEKYNERWKEHGDSHLALGWPDEAMNHRRFEVMWGIVRTNKDAPFHLLDFGCGLGHFWEWIAPRSTYRLRYTGLDINPVFVKACLEKHPGIPFLNLDIFNDDHVAHVAVFDYIICNGVFTEKLDTPHLDQWAYFNSIIERLWRRTRHGIAFNVMSTAVKHKRKDLFHVPFDGIAEYVYHNLSCSFVIRHDYNPWEYTVYVYRE